MSVSLTEMQNILAACLITHGQSINEKFWKMIHFSESYQLSDLLEGQYVIFFGENSAMTPET